MPKTLFDKIWEAHEVADGLIYIDLHLVHEVTSAQAFEALRIAGRSVRRPDRTLATADHNVPTDGSTAAQQIRDQLSRALMTLSVKDREVLILKDVEELSYEEMRTVLGRPITALKIRVIRARLKLKALLARAAEAAALEEGRDDDVVELGAFRTGFGANGQGGGGGAPS